MHGMTAQTTGGRVIRRDLQAAAAAATTTQGADIGYLLGVVHGIAIVIAIEMEIEIKVETGSNIAIRTVAGKQ